MAIITMEGFEGRYWSTLSTITVLGSIDGVATQYGITAISEAATDYGDRLRAYESGSSSSSQQWRCMFHPTDPITDFGDYFAFGYKCTVLSSKDYNLVSIFNSDASGANTGDILTLRRRKSDGACMINDVVSSSSLVIELGVEYFIEIEVDMVALEARCYLTNQLVGTVPLTGAESRFNYWFGFYQTENTSRGTGNVGYLDDHYALDGNGNVNTTRQGKVKVVVRDPQADDTAEFTRDAGTSNASQVAGTPSTDTTFVHSNEEGAVDLYTNSDALPFDAPVVAVAVTVRARKAGVDARAVAPMIESGSADAVGDRINLLVNSLTVGTTIFQTDPATNDAWTQSAAAALKFGQTLVV